MTMITPSYLGETIEYSSLHACRSTLEDPTPEEMKAISNEYLRLKNQVSQDRPAGGFAGQLSVAQTPRIPGESDQAYAQRVGSAYAKLEGGIAGSSAYSRTQGEQNAPHPYADTKTYVAGERAAAIQSLPKAQSAKDFQDSNLTDPSYWKDPQGAYQRYLKQVTGQKQQLDVDLSKYETSSAPAKGVSFQEYMQNRELYDGKAPKQVPATPASQGTRPAGW